ncbi:MAG TPA: hypothetical protein VMN36_03600 [Verrucomicrobiales bacterium]|nr:hypothetical protein [Verrucomicrobiales bacterium]
MNLISAFRDLPGLVPMMLGGLGIVFGLLVFVSGKIPAAIHAFKGNDMVWGILLVTVAPFFPPLGVVYCLLRWREGRVPCLVMLVGTLLIAVSLYLFLRGFLAVGPDLMW